MFLMMAWSAGAFADSVLYRYRNDSDITVIDHQIPPKYVHKGYDILSSDGKFLRTIPRELSSQELQLRNTDESNARYLEEEALRMRKWDESLLLRYSTIADIESAKKRAMRELQIRVSILKSNLSSIKSQIEREQLKAANIERRGADVPEDMSNNIDVLKLEIEDTELSIETRREEIRSVEGSFQRDIDRFSTLQEQVEMRRKMYITPRAKKSHY